MSNKHGSTPFRRLLISKDRSLVVVAHAVENKMILGLGFTEKLPNGFIGEWPISNFDQMPIDMLKFIDFYAPTKNLG